ncbi:hypothetical protein ACIRQH_39275 [Streptomyces sp. NPDC102279]|uniref:hypothetical protein n=1 Tax=Streptomyces sp. NPDC102279 TaxID=3366153 RepID=UPI0037FFF28F
MQGEVVVTLISTAGAAMSAVWVAFLSRGRAPGGDHQWPLLNMGDYCGRVRGAATAAQKDCEQALKVMRRGITPERNAELRDRLFEEARFREVLADGYRFDHQRFDQAVSRFRVKIRQLGEKIDGIADSGGDHAVSRERELADAQLVLRAMTSLLHDVDAQFVVARTIYFDRQVSRPAPRTERRLHKRAERRYRRSAKRGEADMITRLPLIDAGYRDPDGVPSAPVPDDTAGAVARTPADPPPCGYCIWRCPHAPSTVESGGGRGAAAVSGG